MATPTKTVLNNDNSVILWEQETYNFIETYISEIIMFDLILLVIRYFK